MHTGVYVSDADHPRSRGVYRSSSWPRSRPAGSSPLARGLRSAGRECLRPQGIIPARAGFTGSPRAGAGASGDHPRSRGVYTGQSCGCHTPQGSSPLAQGLRGQRPDVKSSDRIIPARAGFTLIQLRLMVGVGDHPRSRGVYSRRARVCRRPRGSSPLARGLRHADPPQRISARIIPARAGFTSRPRSSRRRPRDHPRSRGVYTAPRCRGRCSWGSSPLARGLLRASPPSAPAAGIIPARAGFTLHARRTRVPGRDHPRSRGVYTRRRTTACASRGSSPLARGLQMKDTIELRHVGIIPARAGFTWGDSDSPHQALDHPRSRGVYSRGDDLFTTRLGSSPLARGLHTIRTYLDDNHRIIPARAGFTIRRGTPGPWRGDHPRSRGVYQLRSTTWWSR